MKMLITGIGGDIAQGVATIIKESRPETSVFGADMSNSHAGSLYVDEVFQVPSALSENYLDRMREIIAGNAIDIVVPITEPELSVFAPLIDELGKNRCITVGKEIIELGIDKLKTMHALASLNIPIPWTVQAGKQSPLEFPCIFKAQRGYGSKNIFVIENLEEAKFFENKYPNSIFQEMLEPADKEVTCAVYRKRDGQVAVLQLLRKLTGGLTSWAKVINDPDTLDMCEIIADGLNLYGSMNIQLRITDAGPRVFEINPRLSSTVLMRHRIGFSDLLWALDELNEKKINFPNIAVDQQIVRVQDVQQIQ